MDLRLDAPPRLSKAFPEVRKPTAVDVVAKRRAFVERVLDAVYDIFARWTSPEDCTLTFSASALPECAEGTTNDLSRQADEPTPSLHCVRTKEKHFTGLETSTFYRLVLRHDTTILPKKRQKMRLLRYAKSSDGFLEQGCHLPLGLDLKRLRNAVVNHFYSEFFFYHYTHIGASPLGRNFGAAHRGNASGASSSIKS
jgi:hypothetical protein